MMSYDHWNLVDMAASAKYSCNPAKNKNLSNAQDLLPLKQTEGSRTMVTVHHVHCKVQPILNEKGASKVQTISNEFEPCAGKVQPMSNENYACKVQLMWNEKCASKVQSISNEKCASKVQPFSNGNVLVKFSRLTCTNTSDGQHANLSCVHTDAQHANLSCVRTDACILVVGCRPK
jgi:hypothetical protein